MASRNRIGRNNDNTMAERRLRPIYGTPDLKCLTFLSFIIIINWKTFLLLEWIDNGNYKKALHELDKLIKKVPSQNCSKVCTYLMFSNGIIIEL